MIQFLCITEKLFRTDGGRICKEFAHKKGKKRCRPNLKLSHHEQYTTATAPKPLVSRLQNHLIVDYFALDLIMPFHRTQDDSPRPRRPCTWAWKEDTDQIWSFCITNSTIQPLLPNLLLLRFRNISLSITIFLTFSGCFTGHMMIDSSEPRKICTWAWKE